jgi:hypothetical protein
MSLPFVAKPKTCAQCGTKFMPFSSTSRVCSPTCARKIVKADRAYTKVQTKARKEAIKTNGQRKAEAQAALNRWIVHGRDAHEPCISCGRHHEGMYHAGHYRSRGSAPHLALDERNLSKQCAPCNLYLHGNLIEYRAGLIRRHGLAFVEALESDNTPRHYTGTDYDAIKAEARQKLRNHLKGTS